MKVQTLLLTPEKMAREVATSRTSAMRQSANRENQLILEHDYRLFASGATGQYVSIPNISSYINTLPLLIEFKWYRYSHSKDYKTLTTYHTGYGFQIYDYAPDRVHFMYYVGGGNYVIYSTSYSKFLQRRLVDFLVTTTSAKLYLDGVLQGQVGWTGTGQSASMSADLDLFQGSGVATQAKQEMSHFSIWNLTTTDGLGDVIAARYANYKKNIHLNGDETDLKGYWKMNEGSGMEILDSTINAHNGTIHGCSWRDYGGLRETA